jgi:hypothetical protein
MSNIASEAGFLMFSMLSPHVIRMSNPANTDLPRAARYEESFQLERGWLTLCLELASAP